jgi:hypothetical protein
VQNKEHQSDLCQDYSTGSLDVQALHFTQAPHHLSEPDGGTLTNKVTAFHHSSQARESLLRRRMS